MSNISNEDGEDGALVTQHRTRHRHTRPDILLPDGRTLTPRASLAAEVGVCDATVRRMNPPTTFIGCVAYVDRDGTLQLIGASVNRRNQPPKRRRPRRV